MATIKRNYTLSLAIIATLFFIFGFITWINGALIPFLKVACSLESYAQALLVTFAFYLSYFFLAIPSSFIIGKIGYKKGMSVGLLIMAVGAAVFVPAAYSRSFAVFLSGLFTQGMGLALLQTASNPYVTIIGPIESAARRISMMGVASKVAGALSPLILSAIVLHGASEIEASLVIAASEIDRANLLSQLAQRIVTPYVVISSLLVLMAAAVFLSPLPEIEAEGDNVREPSSAKTSVLQFPHLILGVVCMFLYIGAEVMAGDVIAPYAKSLGFGLDTTKNLTSYTMVFMLIGYIIGICIIPRFISQQTALLWSAVLGIFFSMGALLTAGGASVVFIVLLGLANALMWPVIFPLAISNLGRFTKIGSALVIMSIVGGAIVPQIYALMVSWVSPQVAFFLCVFPACLFIVFYAMKGFRIGLAENSRLSQ
jgi:glucose/galactose transporter